jgi:enoyl-[acyl-carrier-protein] reductase (NADH)
MSEAAKSVLRKVVAEEGNSGVTTKLVQTCSIFAAMARLAYDKHKMAESIAQKAILCRLDRAIDVAPVALFLALELSSYVTAEGVAVDGGPFLRV